MSDMSMKAKLYILALLPLLWSCSSDTPGEGGAEGQHPYLKLTAKVQTRSLTDGKGQDYEIKDFHLLEGNSVVTSQKPEFVKEAVGKNHSDYWELKVRNKGHFKAGEPKTTVWGLANTEGYTPAGGWNSVITNKSGIDFIDFWKNAITSNKGTEELKNHVEWMSKENTRMPVLMYGENAIEFKEDEEDSRYLIAFDTLQLNRVFAKVTVRLKMGPTKDIAELKMKNVPKHFYLDSKSSDGDELMELNLFGGSYLGVHDNPLDSNPYTNLKSSFSNIENTYVDVAEFYLPESKTASNAIQVFLRYKKVTVDNKGYESEEKWETHTLNSDNTNNVLRNHHYVIQIAIGAKETVDIKFYDATDEFELREGVLPFD